MSNLCLDNLPSLSIDSSFLSNDSLLGAIVVVHFLNFSDSLPIFADLCVLVGEELFGNRLLVSDLSCRDKVALHVTVTFSIVHEVAEVLLEGVVIFIQNSSEFFEDILILQPLEIKVGELMLSESDDVIRMMMVMMVVYLVVVFLVHLLLRNLIINLKLTFGIYSNFCHKNIQKILEH